MTFGVSKLKTLFLSQNLWELVDKGYKEEDEELRLKENRKRDSKALILLQQDVSEAIFSRIVAVTTSHQAWAILQKGFQGTSKVITFKLQSLQQDFETMQMKNSENVQVYITRMMMVINQMRIFGDTITDLTVVAKFLRSLSTKFDNVVAAIEESKDLTQLTIDELSGSL